MQTFIVITTINPPSVAIKKFARLKDYQLIVVGDKKTPMGWNLQNVKFIPLEDQNKSGFNLSSKLPVNHYSRKMIGYLEAIKLNAEYIIDTDDDNIPYVSFNFPEFEGLFDFIEGDKGFINIYQLFTNMKIWPRGLPLEFIKHEFQLNENISTRKCNVGMWQGLADNDPDVDAIYRMTSDQPCTFNKRKPVVIGKNTICPFNTQNTKVRKELFPLLYLPSSVTFRYTDILRGLIAQPIMWTKGYLLGFSEATVYQERNAHNYFNDFISEIPMYLTCQRVINLVSSVLKTELSIEDNLFLSYKALFDDEIVLESELECLEEWLNDLSKTNSNS